MTSLVIILACQVIITLSYFRAGLRVIPVIAGLMPSDLSWFGLHVATAVKWGGRSFFFLCAMTHIHDGAHSVQSTAVRVALTEWDSLLIHVPQAVGIVIFLQALERGLLILQQRLRMP